MREQNQQLRALLALPSIAWSGSQVRSLEQLSDEAFWAYASSAANPVAHLPPEPDAYVVCQLSSGSWLLPLDALDEIIPASQPYTRLPATPLWMPGLMAWRGDVIAVIDLDAYLSTLQTIPCACSTCHEGLLLIAHVGTRPLAFHVSAIGATRTIDEEQMQSSTERTSVADKLRPMLLGRYAESWVLDMRRLLNGIVQQIDVLTS